MARTLRGNLTGRAAAEELRDQRIYLAEMAERHAADLKARYYDALKTLRLLDPTGWEAWYDDANNVPDFNGWGNCQPALDAMNRRIAELQAAKPSPTHKLNWKVLEANTVRAYETAAHDYAEVIGSPITTATSETARRWETTMELRGYSVNTIRQRLSALATLSGTKIPLPRRPRFETQALSAEQIRRLMSAVKDSADRMLLVRLLTLGSRAKTVPANEAAFMGRFVGAEREHTLASQNVTRILRKYARLAGLDPKPISLRAWCLSGKRLVESLSPVELADLLSAPSMQEPRSKVLHGIGRRSFAKVS